MAGQQLFYKWKKDGVLVATVEVSVGSERWRSYSSKTLMSGDWQVSAVDTEGNILASTSFTAKKADDK